MTFQVENPPAPTGVPSAGARQASAHSERPLQEHSPRRHSIAFWLIALAFGVTMSFTTVPTTMWSLYERTVHYSTAMVTVAFTAYSFGVLLALVFVGHISDWQGRKPILLIGITCQLVAAIVLVSSTDFAPVVVARFISGAGIGMITATATAHIAELHLGSGRDPLSERPALTATAANLGGLGAGPVIGGALTQFLPHPLVVPYAVYLVVLVIALALVMVAPETVPRHHRDYRPQHVQLAREDRGDYMTAVFGGATLFCVLGLTTSLLPQVLSGLGISSRFWEGLIAACVLFASASVQIALRHAVTDRLYAIGLPAIGVGVICMVLGVLTGLGALFVIGALVGGAGGGAIFRGALGTAARVAPEGRAGESAAGIFVGAYLGMACPVLGIGIATACGISIDAALVCFGILVLALATGVAASARACQRARATRVMGD
ncbi:MFS transporter [Propionibacterium sp.]|uniref:MFS transporter n=1 Tax=Propionibacterium sp. TaxID=1977903 RepID=UPI0039E74429